MTAMTPDLDKNTGDAARRRGRRRSGYLLMGATLLAAVGIFAGAVRRQPDITPPRFPAAQVVAADFQEAVQSVDRQFTQWARTEGVEMAPRADNLTILRRISLALIGTGLSLEEIRAVEMVPADEQVQWWTEYLLQDRRWADYFSERLSRAFVGTNQGPFLLFRRRKFNQWLAEQLEAGRPYDDIVRQMIAADGLWTDTPPVNFITATMDEDQKNRADPVRLAARTARTFLGQRIDCLQCHDDFLGTMELGEADAPESGTQQHFHQLAAFFAGTGLPDPVFRGIRDDGRTYRYKYLGEESEEEVTPQVPFYRELLPTDGKPRQRLAAWVTHSQNRAFARATVNRIWALLCSRPLVEPVDNIPLHGPVPPILDTLADDFQAHGYDLRRLIRLIVHSQAFQRDSRADFEITETHEACWAVFPVTQLRPEQVAGCLSQIARVTAIDHRSSILTRLQSYGELQDFLKRYGDRGEDEFDSDAITIPQRLLLMNGKLTRERTKNDLVGNTATRIARLVGDDGQAVQLAFLTVLNRYPSPREEQVFVAHLGGKHGNGRVRAMSDMFWALINSTEFSWNH
ncbi:MAG: cytochrome c [Pirellulaceae bacterium]|nr:MAG: cytochrome c [Pirellulaceae bacterium]